MKSRTFSAVAVTALVTILFAACSAIARHHGALESGDRRIESRAVAKDDGDPISGEWNVSFKVPGHGTTPATFTFKLDGEKVTGSCYSEHTGAGTIRDGKWVDSKLSFVLDFKKHESIAVKGGLKDGALAGEFTTEGFTANWEAKRKNQ
jgi:hypothetical protein